MRVSKRKINATLEKELFNTFFQLIADLKTPEEADIVLSDLLGKNELKTLMKRVAIIYWLSQGRSISNIRENLAVSPATIEAIKKDAQNLKGLQLAVKKINADEWAMQWSQKIKKFVR